MGRRGSGHRIFKQRSELSSAADAPQACFLFKAEGEAFEPAIQAFATLEGISPPCADISTGTVVCIPVTLANLLAINFLKQYGTWLGDPPDQSMLISTQDAMAT